LILVLVEVCLSHGRLPTHILRVPLHVASRLHPLHLTWLRWRHSTLNLVLFHLLHLAWVHLVGVAHTELALRGSGYWKIRSPLSLRRIVTRVLLGHGTHLLLRHVSHDLLITYLTLKIVSVHVWHPIHSSIHWVLCCIRVDSTTLV
jgi:hypothetical protein